MKAEAPTILSWQVDLLWTRILVIVDRFLRNILIHIPSFVPYECAKLYKFPSWSNVGGYLFQWFFISAFDISNISSPERWLVLRFHVYVEKSNLRVYFNYSFLTDKLKS